MRTTSILLTIFSALTITACGQKTESYTTDYLQQHDDVRAKVLEDCKANKQTDENCKNANEANSKVTADEMRKKINR